MVKNVLSFLELIPSLMQPIMYKTMELPPILTKTLQDGRQKTQFKHEGTSFKTAQAQIRKLTLAVLPLLANYQLVEAL